MKQLRRMLKEIVVDICITDWFLLLFMIVLFFYMVFYLFTGVGSSEENNTINVIIRTSMASIFGYFISANFSKTRVSGKSQRKENGGKESPLKTIAQNGSQTVQNRIGFQTVATSKDQESGGASVSEDSSAVLRQCSNVQVGIVAIIGMASLLVLIITGRLQNITPELTAMMSQLRDFVAASIGFLISCGKSTAD